MSPFALADTYWPAFEKAVKVGGAQGVMCSYNAVNGQPACASDTLTSVLRGAWGFSGYITSDSGALEDVYLPFPKGHHYVNTEAEAACVSIRNGTTDVCSGAVYHDSLMDSVSSGLCSRADVDAALYRTMMVRMKAGLFDPIEDQPYWHTPLTAVNTPASEDANLRATLSSMVLLKHDGSTLPFARGKRIAVIGPHANASAALVGNYLGQLCDDDSLNCVLSPFLALQSANTGGSVAMAAGCGLTKNDTSGFAAALALAAASDYVVLALGIDGSIEGESNDRTDIDLPAIQHALAAQVAAVGKPTALVLVHGGSLDTAAELANQAIGAMVDAFYPGMRGSEAIAATLLGDNDRCCGKMAFTTYHADYVDQIKMSDMELDGAVGRGYRYFAGDVVFPFAHGLALTSFQITDVSGTAPREVLRTEAGAAAPARVLSYSVNVTNTGATTGDEVVFLFMEPQAGTLAAQPGSALIKKLLDYERVHLAPGESVVVSFDVSAASLRMVDKASGDVVSTPGEFRIALTNGVTPVPGERVVVVEGAELVATPFPGRTR